MEIAIKWHDNNDNNAYGELHADNFNNIMVTGNMSPGNIVMNMNLNIGHIVPRITKAKLKTSLNKK